MLMLSKDLKGILQNQAQIFQETYFESSQIHQLTITYRQIMIFLQIFYFKIFVNFFLHARKLRR